ncbi:MAG TPA: hypothetical protein DCQ37_22125, partial [Desulfobacteraceae bacterium]|nr:hypothetical protein [Desulfobacteraceae bacterium]
MIETNNFKSESRKFNSLLDECLKSKNKYQDEEFKPCPDSLTGFCEPKLRSKYEKYCWARPEEYYTNPSILKQIGTNDIMQGALGDCYLLGTISAIAKYPERITRLFSSKTINNAGIYCVQICVTGIWEDVIIDDYFPCFKQSKKPAFANSESGDIWVMLLEKAWAKVHGGYHNISGGLVREVLRDLTGAPAETFFTKEHDLDFHWKNISEAIKNRFIMGCGSEDISKTGDDSQDKTSGIANTHAYSLIAVYEIKKEPSGKRVLRSGEPSSPYNDRIVKLRNPWGKGEWKGAWSDDSPEWTPKLKEELGFKAADDGMFHIGLKDFLEYFYDYQICYFNEAYNYSAQKFKSLTEEPTVIEFELKSPGEYYFSINQTNKRMFRPEDEYAYSQLTLFISRRRSNGSFKFIGSATKADKEMWFKANCEPGRYVAYVLTPWRRKVNEFSISVYGKSATNFNKIDLSNLPPTFFESLLMERTKKDKNTIRCFDAQGEPKIMYKLATEQDGFGCCYFSNESEETQLTATVDFTESTGVQILPPYAGQAPVVFVGPKEEKILVFRLKTSEAKASYKITSTFRRSIDVLINTANKQGQNQLTHRDISINSLPHQGGLSVALNNSSEDSTYIQTLS